MYEPPAVVYYGPDASRVAADWEGGRELRLSGVEPGDAEAVQEAEFDALVVHADGDSDGLTVVERVSDPDDDRPVVVLSSCDDLTPETALAAGATNYVEVDPPFDAEEILDAFADEFAEAHASRRERSMLDSLLAHIPVSVFFKDEATRHVRVSDAMPSLTGPDYHENEEGKRHPTPADVEGKTEFDLYESAKAQRAMADDLAVIETGEPIEATVEEAGDGPLDTTYLRTYKAPWYDRDGEVIGTAGIAMDITERKRYEHRLEQQNERLEQQNERLEQFTHVLSHDLRNPLEVAHGRLEFAKRTGDPEHFEAIETALTRMEQLIDDVLALAQEGESVSETQPTDLATVAADAWRAVDASEAHLDVAGDLTIQADPSRLRQLLENLYRNAVEHGSTSPPSQAREDAVEHGSTSSQPSADDAVEHGSAGEGAPSDEPLTRGAAAEPEAGAGDSEDAGAAADETLTISVGALADGTGFFVADDGRGIPVADRERVFESGYTTDPENTGLGLSIVRSIAEAHGWEASITESEGGGARFEFRGVDQVED